jgi:hypothetical protein
MLLLDDDDELPVPPEEGEATLTARLGADGLHRIDLALLRSAQSRWLKVARVVHDAATRGGFDVTADVVDLHARRVMALAESGALEAKGDLRKPRSSEIRLPQKPEVK